MLMPDTIPWIIESTISPIIAPGQLHGDLDAKRAGAAHVVRVDDEYRMYHWGTSADDYNRILLATSPAEQPNAWAPQGVILERQPDDRPVPAHESTDSRRTQVVRLKTASVSRCAFLHGRT